MTQQGDRQASIRAVSGSTLDIDGDWHALWDFCGIPAGAFNERMLAYCNVKLGAAYTNVNDAMQALAAANGAANFSSLGTFNAATALFLTGTPGVATQNVAYSWTPTFGGGAAPYTFSIVAGTLPNGLSLNTSTGVISGTPTGTGTSSGITLRITDSAGSPAHVDLTGLSITVYAQLAITNSPGTTANAGSAYTYTPTTSGGHSPLTWSIVNKPSWAAFSTSTGILTGTPSGAEVDAGVNITATDVDGRTASTGAFTITVTATPSNGTITAARITSEGWVLELDIKGFKPGGNVGQGKDTTGAYSGGANTVQYDLGSETTPKVTVAISGRSGFDPTTGGAVSNLTDTAVGTISLRKPYSVSGAEQTNDETDNGTYVTIRHALNKRVLAGETALVSVSANTYTDNGAGGTGLGNNAVTNLAVTNNSTDPGVKPICAYLTVPRQRLVTDFVFEFGVAHEMGRLGRMVAAVVMTWKGATSGVTVTKTVTSMGLSGFFRSTMPRVCVFSATLTTADIATFTQGEEVDWSCEARPFVGPAFVASTDGTAFPTPRMAQSLPFVCDKNNTLAAFATVDPAGALASTSTAGCTSTDTEQTNTANCYPSINAALTALKTFMGRNESAGGVIYMRAGTYADFGNFNTTTFTFGLHWLHIKPAPSTNRAGVILTTTAGQSITGNLRRIGAHVHFYNLTMTTLANATLNDNVLINGPDSTSTPTKAVWVDNCIVTSLSTATTPSACFSAHGQQYFTNNDMSGKLTMTLGSGRGYYLVGGNDFNNCATVNIAGPFVGNYGRGGTSFLNFSETAANVVLPDQVFYCFNYFTGSNVVSPGWFGSGTYTLPHGVAKVQNLTENFSQNTVSATNMSGDSDVNQIFSFVDAYNTTVGERYNQMYNSTGLVAIPKRGVTRFSLFYARYVKRDTFSDPVNGKQAGRVGNWNFSHSVDGGYSVTMTVQFGFSKVCSNSDIGDHFPYTAIATSVAFVNDLSGLSGAGGGDYRLVGPTNAAYGRVPSGFEMLPYDILGTARDGAAGCYAKAS
jgi:hypothetical protein